MSLIILYKDEFVGDRRCVFEYPHAIGLLHEAKKLHVASDMTFAFGITGQTLSEKEMHVMEVILRESFKEADGEKEYIELTHADWFETRPEITFLVMTKNANYYGYLVNDKIAERMTYKPNVPDATKPWLVRFDSFYPAGYGTGFQVASMAVQEGVAMKELTPIVADIIYSVSIEHDYVHRESLKGMFL